MSVSTIITLSFPCPAPCFATFRLISSYRCTLAVRQDDSYFRAFHVDIWVAFVGFFLPLVVAFAPQRRPLCVSGNAGLHRHNPSSSSAGTALVTAVTVVTAVLDAPADCRNCHPYPLHDGHDDGDGVLDTPSQEL